MKKNKKKLSASMLSLVIIAITLILFVTACSKSGTSTPNANFAGTYDGNIVVSGVSVTDTITIPISTPVSATTDMIDMNSRTGRGSVYTIDATVSGNTFTIISTPPQTITTALGTYTVTGNGTLINSDSLVINYMFSSYQGTFTGIKKS